MSEKQYNVLVLCTGNSARSILGEVLFNNLGKGKFKAYSAGSKPAGKVNPGALEWLQVNGYSSEGLRSKSWDEFVVPGAPEFDFIFTVCDNAAGEACPLWLGKPAMAECGAPEPAEVIPAHTSPSLNRAHWGIPDPAHIENDEARREAFIKTAERLTRRIQLLLALPIDKLDRLTLKEKLAEIGRIQD
jgi:arsenate reductase